LPFPLRDNQKIGRAAGRERRVQAVGVFVVGGAIKKKKKKKKT
jgi:hypothetical protein